jgi:predicted TIM-barrel fold metal-dependent hydrolase
MAGHTVISADSHVVEPADLWTELIDPQFRDRAPHVEEQDGNEVFVVDGLPSQWKNQMGLLGTAGVANENLHKYTRRRDANPGGSDPHARIKDMAADGVDAEVLYSSMSMPINQVRDAAYQAACFRAYNDWLADFCSVYPDKLIGIGLISLLDLEAGIAEVSRIAKKGLRGAAVSLDLAAETDEPYWSAAYDPFWAQAAELGMPISMHALTGATAWTKGKFARVAFGPATMQETIANLIEFGVFERFPKLRVISVENDAGWVPNFAARLDHAYERGRHYQSGESPLTMKPSEYVRRHLSLTFMYDKVAVEQRAWIGTETLLWASDYPHGNSTWPKSEEYIEWQFGDIPAEERQMMIHDNVANLYGMS